MSCPSCFAPCGSVEELEVHQRLRHTAEDSFFCFLCNHLVANTARAVKRHCVASEECCSTHLKGVQLFSDELDAALHEGWAGFEAQEEEEEPLFAENTASTFPGTWQARFQERAAVSPFFADLAGLVSEVYEKNCSPAPARRGSPAAATLNRSQLLQRLFFASSSPPPR